MQEAPADALAILLGSLDLVKDAEVVGIETVPDHLAGAISAALEKHAPLAARPRRPSARRTLWDETHQPDLFEEAEAGEAFIEKGDASPAEGTGAPAIAAPPKPLLAAPPPVKIREELEQLALADLLGPAGGPEEEVDERTITDRYLIGMLAPQRRRIGPDAPEEREEDAPSGRRRVRAPEDHDELAVAGADSAEEGSTESEAQSATFYPSSFGLTCCVSGEAKARRVRATWGRYRRVPSATLLNPKSGNPKLIWKREPMGDVLEDVPLQVGPIATMFPDARQPEVIVRGLVRRLGENWIITLFLVNTQREPRKLRDLAWIFQPELQVEASDSAPMFCRQGPGWAAPGKPTAEDAAPDEEQAMAMPYRQRVEFAVGHGVSVYAELASGQPERAVRIRTRTAPTYEVAQTTSPTADDLPGLADLALDMRALAEAADADLARALTPLVTSYAAWIAGQLARVEDPTFRAGGTFGSISQSTPNDLAGAHTALAHLPDRNSHQRGKARRADTP